MKGLNFGCGPDHHEGWEHFDRDDYEFNDVGDVLNGMPYDDECFDVIVANHVLQMIKYVDMPKALEELRRVLRTGGVLRVLVPDLLSAISAYERGDKAWFPIVDEAEKSIGGKLCAYVSWYSEANLVFTPSWTAELLQRNGFSAAICAPGMTLLGSRWPEILDLDSRPRESIVVEGIRVEPEPEEDEF